MNKSRSGFTIVELLIVIVVIGILATITVVAFNGVQQRARDSIRKQHISQIAKAYQLYKIDTGGLIGLDSGCGRHGSGEGWFNYGGGAIDGMATDDNYTKSIATCLSEAGYLNEEIKDPKGPIAYHAAEKEGKHTYMSYRCTSGSEVTVYVFGVLENSSQAMDIQNSDMCNWAKTSSLGYGMNYYVSVK